MTTKQKKSFIIHIDSLSILDELNNEQAGMLFKAIRAHHNDEQLELDCLTKIAFSPFKNQFIRDAEKYVNVCAARAASGSKGGKQKVANASKSKQKVANVAESDSKSDNDSDSKKDNNSKKKEYIPYQLIADVYNQFAISTNNPTISTITNKRKTIIKKAWQLDTDNANLKLRSNSTDYFERLFKYAEGSEFLNGNTQRGEGHSSWKPSFEFMLREDTHLKLREGNY